MKKYFDYYKGERGEKKGRPLPVNRIQQIEVLDVVLVKYIFSQNYELNSQHLHSLQQI